MELFLVKSNKEFNQIFKDYLKKDEIKLQLFLRNLSNHQMIDATQIRGGIYTNQSLDLMFLNAYPFNLQIYSFTNNKDAFSLLVDYLINHHISINGVQGNWNDCTLFIQEYSKKTNLKFQLHFSMKIMKLTKETLKKPLITGSLRQATKDDIFTILKIYHEFLKEALNETKDIDYLYNEINKMIETKQLYVFINSQKQLTSCIKLIHHSSNGGALSFVFTAKEYRNLGYAKEMIYLLANSFLKTKKYLTLFVDQNKIIPNKLYIGMGFTYEEENYDYRFIQE